MTLIQKAQGRDRQRQQVMRNWAQAHQIELDRLDTGQQWVIYAALRAAQALGAVSALGRVLTFALSHCGMDLSAGVIAAVVDVSDRTVRHIRGLSPEELQHQIRHPPGGNRPPSLQPAHAGPLAKFLVLHPTARSPQILGYIKDTWHIELERHTLHDFMGRYGLGELQQDRPLQAPPFWAPPPTAEPSCC